MFNFHLTLQLLSLVKFQHFLKCLLYFNLIYYSIYFFIFNLFFLSLVVLSSLTSTSFSHQTLCAPPTQIYFTLQHLKLFQKFPHRLFLQSVLLFLIRIHPPLNKIKPAVLDQFSELKIPVNTSFCCIFIQFIFIVNHVFGFPVRRILHNRWKPLVTVGNRSLNAA